jgi:hypothetical protein
MSKPELNYYYQFNLLNLLVYSFDLILVNEIEQNLQFQNI